MYCQDTDIPVSLYGFGVTQAELPGFCERLQDLPPRLLPLALDGLYRRALVYTQPSRERRGVEAVFTDFAGEGWIVRFLCTARVRSILQEYDFGCGPFFFFPPYTTRWLANDRFVQRSGGEYWSLARCLAVVGVRPVHRCPVSGETR
jgi:hypothetical protein